MGRLEQVSVAAVLLAGLGGCAATDRLTAGYLDARRAIGVEPAPARPATQVSLLFGKQLHKLPGAENPDVQQLGLPGQLFVLGADNKPTEVAGPVVLTVTDCTPRADGRPAKTPEKWEFTPDVLARLRTTDRYLGQCYVLFLPWPAGWEDVTRVTVAAQHRSNGVDLFTQQSHVILDGQEVQVREAQPFAVPRPAGLRPGQAPPGAFAVPLEQAGPGVLPPPGPPVSPVVPVVPPVAPPVGPIVPVLPQASDTPAVAPPAGGFQRVVLPRG